MIGALRIVDDRLQSGVRAEALDLDGKEHVGPREVETVLIVGAGDELDHRRRKGQCSDDPRHLALEHARRMELRLHATGLQHAPQDAGAADALPSRRLEACSTPGNVTRRAASALSMASSTRYGGVTAPRSTNVRKGSVTGMPARSLIRNAARSTDPR